MFDFDSLIEQLHHIAKPSIVDYPTPSYSLCSEDNWVSTYQALDASHQPLIQNGVAILFGESYFLSLLPLLLKRGVSLLILADIDPDVHQSNQAFIEAFAVAESREDYKQAINCAYLEEGAHGDRLGKYHFLHNEERYQASKAAFEQIGICQIDFDIRDWRVALSVATMLKAFDREISFLNISDRAFNKEFDSANQLRGSIPALLKYSAQAHILYRKNLNSRYTFGLDSFVHIMREAATEDGFLIGNDAYALFSLDSALYLVKKTPVVDRRAACIILEDAIMQYDNISKDLPFSRYDNEKTMEAKILLTRHLPNSFVLFKDVKSKKNQPDLLKASEQVVRQVNCMLPIGSSNIYDQHSGLSSYQKTKGWSHIALRGIRTSIDHSSLTKIDWQRKGTGQWTDTNPSSYQTDFVPSQAFPKLIRDVALCGAHELDNIGKAIFAVIFQAGNCTEKARYATFLLCLRVIDHLSEGDNFSIKVVDHPHIDHRFLRVSWNGKHFICDPWLNFSCEINDQNLEEFGKHLMKKLIITATTLSFDPGLWKTFKENIKNDTVATKISIEGYAGVLRTVWLFEKYYKELLQTAFPQEGTKQTHLKLFKAASPECSLLLEKTKLRPVNRIKGL